MCKIVAGKGRVGVATFESAETAHFKLLCYFGDAIKYAVSAENKMVVRNRPLGCRFQNFPASVRAKHVGNNMLNCKSCNIMHMQVVKIFTSFTLDILLVNRTIRF